MPVALRCLRTPACTIPWTQPAHLTNIALAGVEPGPFFDVYSSCLCQQEIMDARHPAAGHAAAHPGHVPPVRGALSCFVSLMTWVLDRALHARHGPGSMIRLRIEAPLSSWERLTPTPTCRRVTLTTRHLTNGTMQLTIDAPVAELDPAAFIPPPLRPQAVGWYPEWNKVMGQRRSGEG